MEFSPQNPAAWRVSFRVFVSARRAATPKRPQSQGAEREAVFVVREDRRAPPKRTPRAKRANAATQTRGKRLLRQDRAWMMHEPKLRFRSAWPLAERYEALLRVFHDPAPYARRLSRRLHATPHRLAEALRAPPDAHGRVDRFQEFYECAERSWRPHFSSA